MTIINLGTCVVNNYLISSEAGWILIDTGYAGGFPRFLKQLTFMATGTVRLWKSMGRPLWCCHWRTHARSAHWAHTANAGITRTGIGRRVSERL